MFLIYFCLREKVAGTWGWGLTARLSAPSLCRQDCNWHAWLNTGPSSFVSLKTRDDYSSQYVKWRFFWIGLSPGLSTRFNTKSILTFVHVKNKFSEMTTGASHGQSWQWHAVATQNQGASRGKEKIILTSVGIEPTTSGLDLPLLCRLSYEVGQRKSGTIRRWWIAAKRK